MFFQIFAILFFGLFCPVSYTHLDVYKSQAQKFGQIVPMMLFLLIFQRECQLLFSRLFSRLINDDPDQIIIHLIRMNSKIFSLIQYDAVFFSRCGQLFQKGTKLLRMR